MIFIKNKVIPEPCHFKKKAMTPIGGNGWIGFNGLDESPISHKRFELSKLYITFKNFLSGQ